jgi:hypothetical protein
MVLVLAVDLLGGCAPGGAEHVTVDGLSAGASCGACIDPWTGKSVAALARQGIDERWPGHPPIVMLTMHHQGSYVGPNGEQVLQVRSGSFFIGLATFDDGTRHAVGVYCGISSCFVPGS